MSIIRCYAHSTQCPTRPMSHPLHHILDSMCSSTILVKHFPRNYDLNISTSEISLVFKASSHTGGGPLSENDGQRNRAER